MGDAPYSLTAVPVPVRLAASHRSSSTRGVVPVALRAPRTRPALRAPRAPVPPFHPHVLTQGVPCTTDASSSRSSSPSSRQRCCCRPSRPAMTYDQAVDQLYAKGYPQNVETYLNSLGTSPLGFRLGGTRADDAAARYLAAQAPRRRLRQRQARGGAGGRVGRARRQRHRRQARPSSARSSPACPAPTTTASPPRWSTSATASPPTTRAST